MRLRGRLIVNVIDDPDSLEPSIILEAEGDVMALDAVIGFGKALDRVINGPIPGSTSSTWRRIGPDFEAAVKAGEQCLSEGRDPGQRADRQAGLIRAAIDDILKPRKTLFLARRDHVDS